jgi:putative tryptophan/tyrosine transport system substrate-binding protein
MRRRNFITLLGGAAVAWPLAAHAQQPAMPLVGFLDPRSPDAVRDRLRAFRQGLKETGYVEGENVTIASRFAENQIDRLHDLAADLVRRQVAVIATSGEETTLVAKSATTTVPILFTVSRDPVSLGLVASLAHPGGNVTGVNFFASELVAKRLELLRELVPRASRVAVLVNPANATIAETTLRDVEAAARAMGLSIPDSQCQQQPRDRCSLRDACARAGRCPPRRRRPLFQQPARAIRQPGGAPFDSHGNWFS